MREKRREGDLSRRKGLREKFLRREKIDREEVRDAYQKKKKKRGERQSGRSRDWEGFLRGDFRRRT